MKVVLLVVFITCQLFANNLTVPFNQGGDLVIEDGDTIELSNFPTGWAYNLINLQIDAKSNEALGELKCDEIKKSFSSWTTSLNFPLSCGKGNFIYSGPSQTIRFTWWVTQGPVVQSPNNIVWKNENVKYQNLGVINAENIFDFTTQNFIISKLPNWNYNVIKVSIEPLDGNVIDGYVYLGKKRRSLKGWYQTFQLSENGGAPNVFTLSLNQKRKLKIRWWVENNIPNSKEVKSFYISNEDVYEYKFTENHFVSKDLKLSFDLDDFQDGEIPKITRLEHNQQNVKYNYPVIEHNDSFFLEVRGPTYNIEALPNKGKLISIALPIPENIKILGEKSGTISLMHFNLNGNYWEEIMPDSIGNDYVYFRASSFSAWYVRAWNASVSGLKSGWDATVDFTVDALQAIGTFADDLIDAFVEFYDFITNGVCSLLDAETYVNLVGISFSDGGTWSAPEIDFGNMFSNSSGLSASEIERRFLKGNIQNCSITGIQAVDQKHCFEIGTQNIKLLLADIIYSQQTGAGRRFSVNPKQEEKKDFDNLSNQGMIQSAWNPISYEIIQHSNNQVFDLSNALPLSSTLLNSSFRVLNLLQECDGALGLADEYASTWKHLKGVVTEFQGLAEGNLSGVCKNVFGLVGDAVDWVWPDAVSCLTEGASFSSYYESNNLGSYWSPSSEAIPSRDDHVLAATDYLNNLSILLWANKDYRIKLGHIAGTLRNQLQMFIGLTHDLYNNNNIAIKSMAGIALWDYVNTGSLKSYNTLKSWLNNQSGDSGGYAEGTGYLMYVNQDVPYVLSALLRIGAIQRSDLPDDYLKSGDWLWNLSREFVPACNTTDACLKNSGITSTNKTLLPVEVDDGIIGYNPDFNVFSFLSLNKNLSQNSGDINYFSPIQILGNVADSDFSGQPIINSHTQSDVYFADGAGLIRAKDENGENVYLSIVAESGKMRTNGYGHDQQDNGSITMSHASKGAIVVDPGYNGFSYRNLGYSRYTDHNVLRLDLGVDPNGGQSPNGKMTNLDVTRALAAQPGVHNLDFLATDWDDGAWDYIWKWFAGQFTTVGIYSVTKTIFDIIKDDNVNDDDFKAGGSDVNWVKTYPNGDHPLGAYGIEVEQQLASYTNRRLIFYWAGHMWIVDRPDQSGLFQSSIKWYQGIDKLDQKEPSLGASYNQEKGLWQIPTRFNLTDNSPSFITKELLSGSEFTQFSCGNSTCFSRIDFPSGLEEYIVIPPWGEFFDYGSILFGQNITSSGLILGRRQIGSVQFDLKEFGKIISSNKLLALENLSSIKLESIIVDNTGVGNKSISGKINWTKLGAYNGPLPALQLLKGQ